MKMPRFSDRLLLDVQNIQRLYGARQGCQEISFQLHHGEVLGIVGESGSGKSTLLRILSGMEKPDSGRVLYYPDDDSTQSPLDLYTLPESRLRAMLRLEWGMVQQNPRDGLRMNVSAGANISERLMARGDRHYGQLRKTAKQWMSMVELDESRIDETPLSFSGGMQQRLQIARTLVTQPRLVFMDEPTGGLDVSVQARLLDLVRTLVRQMGLAVVLVTHDLAVARLLADRLIVMRRSHIVETGLTDQVLDDPQHAYSQLLVSSVLTP